MRFTSLLTLLAAPALVSATLHPASSNTKGFCPSKFNCSPAKVSQAIQAAECGHNRRATEKQTFAVFVQDHQYDRNHGAPYGTCSAYTCAPPAPSDLKANADCWIFYWSNNGTSSGVGTGCIRDPTNGVCGCEDSQGKFFSGRSDCT